MAVVLGTDGTLRGPRRGGRNCRAGDGVHAMYAAVAFDKHDQVYAFNRGKNPMVVFDRD